MFKNLVHIFDGDDRPAAALCDQVIEIGNKYPLEDGKVGFAGEGSKNTGLRRSELRWIPHNETMIANMIMFYVNYANRHSFGLDASWLYEIQLTAYHGSDAGYYNWHQDCILEQPEPYQRKLSFIMQLSRPDEYEGGDLMFMPQYIPGWNEQKAAAVREQGTVIVFPSFYAHKVTPVTKGTRRSLVAWVEGPAWR